MEREVGYKKEVLRGSTVLFLSFRYIGNMTLSFRVWHVCGLRNGGNFGDILTRKMYPPKEKITTSDDYDDYKTSNHLEQKIAIFKDYNIYIYIYII